MPPMSEPERHELIEPIERALAVIGHPDHLATGEATLSAVYPAARDRLNFPELLEEGLDPWKVRQVLVTGAERPNLWVDVGAHLDVALAALRCHASQFDDWDAVQQ